MATSGSFVAPVGTTPPGWSTGAQGEVAGGSGEHREYEDCLLMPRVTQDSHHSWGKGSIYYIYILYIYITYLSEYKLIIIFPALGRPGPKPPVAPPVRSAPPPIGLPTGPAPTAPAPSTAPAPLPSAGSFVPPPTGPYVPPPLHPSSSVPPAGRLLFGVYIPFFFRKWMKLMNQSP